MPDPSQPPRMLKSPLVLKAMTLRGRGPYLHGARLDIRPLTILCGENGSGKSIWIELMRDMWWALCCSYTSGFPWWGLVRTPDFKHEINSIDRNGLHSAIVAAAVDTEAGLLRGDMSTIESRDQLFENHAEDEATFGLPGTIGFEVLATDDFDLIDTPRETFSIRDNATSRVEQFLLTGRMRSGDTVQIRWCPLREDDACTGSASVVTVEPAGLTELLELTFNGSHLVRIQHRHGTGIGEDSNDLPEDDLYFAIECSPSFWGETGKDASTPVALGLVEVLVPIYCGHLKEDAPTPNSPREWLERLNALVHGLLRVVVLENFFPIGPIRITHLAQETTTSRVTLKDAIQRKVLESDTELWERERLRRFLDSRVKNAEGEPIEVETENQQKDRLEQIEQEVKMLFATSEQTSIEKRYRTIPLKRQKSKSAQDASVTSPDDPQTEMGDIGEKRPARLEPEFDTENWCEEDGFSEKEEWCYNGTFRYVGEDGRNTQELWARYAYCLMREPSHPFAGSFSNEFESEDFVDDSTNGIVKAVNSLPEEVSHRLLAVCEGSLREEWTAAVAEETANNTLALRLLNQLLPQRNLYASKAWPSVIGEAELLLGQNGMNLPQLHDEEIVRLNRLLLEEAFARNGERRCHHRTGYLFEAFFSYWMERLTGTAIQYGQLAGSDTWKKLLKEHVELPRKGSPLVGGLTEDNGASSTWMPRGRDFCQTQREVEPTDEAEDLKHVIYPATSALATAWATMSTGFHQLAPIVLQAGLLQQNELMSIQNPEAHLHPSLQIKVAEFLMHQALAGKNIIIETHSDLFVRRILRAIREEDIKQEAVRIYFTHLENGPDDADWKHAVMEQLQINDQGQIANWPKGFMDDDLEEANRWLAALERQRSFNDEE